MTIEQVLKRAYRFNHMGTAISFSSRTAFGSAVLHGDDGKYWVCTMADAEWLSKRGYEWVK